jgi:O-antigen ligase
VKSLKPQLKTAAFFRASAGKQNFLILGILFLLPIYLIKIKLGWISFNLLELLIAILFVVWLFNKERKHQIPNTKYQIAVLLIFTGLVLSTIANKNFYSGLGVIKGWFLFPIIFAVIFGNELQQNEGLLKKSLLILFYSGIAISAIGIVYFFLGYMTYDGRLRIFWDSPNQLAMFLAVPFLAGIARFNLSRTTKVEPWKRLVIIFGLCLIFISLYLTHSYGAWLALAVSTVIFYLHKINMENAKKYLVFFLAVLVFFSWLGFEKYKNIKSAGARSSLSSRIIIWRSTRLMVEKNPVFGIGPGNFQEKYLEYQKYFPPYLEWSAPQPHNVFLAFWLESGLPGLIGFLWVLCLFFRDNKKAINRDRSLGTLFLAVMAYILIHGLVDTTYWRNDLALVFWLIIAANYYLAQSEKTADISL